MPANILKRFFKLSIYNKVNSAEWIVKTGARLASFIFKKIKP